MERHFLKATLHSFHLSLFGGSTQRLVLQIILQPLRPIALFCRVATKSKHIIIYSTKQNGRIFEQGLDNKWRQFGSNGSPAINKLKTRSREVPNEYVMIIRCLSYCTKQPQKSYLPKHESCLGTQTQEFVPSIAKELVESPGPFDVVYIKWTWCATR